MTHPLPVHLLLALGLSAAIPACSRSRPDIAHDTKTTVPSATAETKPAPVAQPVVLNGCLQKGTRGVYILTELSEPKHRDSSKQGVIERERTDAARHAYRLISVRESDLSKLVGKEVRVQGIETQASDLNPPPAAAATAGEPASHIADATGATRITQQDLAKVQVDSIRTMGRGCGGSTHRKTGAKRA